MNKTKEFILNQRRYSSFDLSEEYMAETMAKLNQFQPKYLRGYASSIYLFAKYIKDSKINIDFQPKGVFTTSEVLFDYQRECIEEVFDCGVFNQYGLNDGGISAYECEMHKGLHVDMTRSFLEVVNDDGIQLETGRKGHILATSLYNYAMPFIRYDTGDLGVLSDEMCECGRNTPLLKKIVGRVSDFIYAPNGVKIHGEFFSHIFYEIDWVRQFQIVQRKMDELIIKIVPESNERINENDLSKLNQIIINRTGEMNIIIEIVDQIETTKSGKWKFIVREI
jgi:phenylacetate-CoA ligase